MKEEEVTKKILNYLIREGFSIFSYDFPQSGTGYAIRPNCDEVTSSHKNLSIWIPDIISFKGEKLLFFENKNYYSEGDIEKIKIIRGSNYYSDKIKKLFSRTGTQEYFVVIGYPLSFNRKGILPPEIDAEFKVDSSSEKIEINVNNPKFAKVMSS